MHSVSTGFARLLASDRDSHGLAFESPLSHIKHHFERLAAQPGHYAPAYTAIARRVAFARAIEKRIEPAALASLATGLLPLSRWTCGRLARRIVAEAKTHGSALFPCDTNTHAFLMEFVSSRGGAGPWTVRIYNSGDGLTEHHTKRLHGKVQTMFEVRNIAWGPGRHHLNMREVAKLLRHQVRTRDVLGLSHQEDQAVHDVYAWAACKGDVYNPPRNTVQASQKVGNCTLKCILAFLRNNLDDVPYCEARAALFENSADGYATKQHRAMHPALVAKIQNHAQAARAKASRAQAVHTALSRARNARYMHPQNDPCAVRSALASHVHLGQALYCMFYRPDTRDILLATASTRAPESDGCYALRPVDASGFVLDGESFASLDMVANTMERRGFAPCIASAPPPACERGEWLTRLSALHQDMPAFKGVMSRGHAENLLRGSRPKPRYLVRSDPSCERFFFSLLPASKDGSQDVGVGHIAIDIDPYTGQLMCGAYAMTMPTLPDMVAALLVQTERYALRPLGQ